MMLISSVEQTKLKFKSQEFLTSLTTSTQSLASNISFNYLQDLKNSWGISMIGIQLKVNSSQDYKSSDNHLNLMREMVLSMVLKQTLNSLMYLEDNINAEQFNQISNYLLDSTFSIEQQMLRNIKNTRKKKKNLRVRKNKKERKVRKRKFI